MPTPGQYEHPFYNIAQNVFGGRERDEALQEHQFQLALEQKRRLLQMAQDVANQESERQARLMGEGLGRMAPSTTVRNPTQPGPVLEEPSLDIPGVTGPLPPSSLADTVFPGPGRATWGNEALRPQAAPGEPAPYPIKPPEQEWRDVYPAVLPPPTRPTPPETLGGATTAEPPVPQGPLPYTPAPVRPGGVREEVPGMPLDQLLRERPAEAAAVLQNRKAVTEAGEAETEAAGRKAVRDYVRARKAGTSEKAALDQYGDAMEASDVGRKFLTSIDVRRKTEAEAETKERALAKEQRAQELLAKRVAELRQSTDPADQEMATLLEAYAADPKLAERLEAARKARVDEEANRLKAEELRGKPIEIGGIGYRWVTNEAGEKALAVIPGQQVKPEKSKWDGITTTELDTMIANPATSPEDRAIAEKAIARIERREVKRAEAGVPKPTAASEKLDQEHYNMLLSLDQVSTIVRQHPEYISGWSSLKYAAAYDSPDYLKGVANVVASVPPGYATFRARLDPFTADRLNELAGSALTEGEIKRYAAFLPNVYQPPERFRANVQVSREMLTAALEYHKVRQASGSHEEARAAVRAAIKRVADAYVAEHGEPPPDTGQRRRPARSAAEAAQNLGIQRTAP